MAATLLRRSFQSRQLSTLSSLAVAGKSKLSSPLFGSKWSSLTRSFSSRPVRNDVIGIDLGTTNSCVTVMEGKLDKAKMEARAKDESIRKLDKNLQNLENKANGRDHTYKTHQEKIRELEDELGEKSALHSQTEKQISQLQERLKGKEEVCYSLQRKELTIYQLLHMMICYLPTMFSLKTGLNAIPAAESGNVKQGK